MSPYEKGFEACVRYFRSFWLPEPINPYPVGSEDYDDWQAGYRKAVWTEC